MAPAGIEPATQGFSVLCSTDWAMEPKKWRFRRDSDSRSSAWQADVITTTPRNHGCGRWIWTNDLWVMSPTSYQAALSRDIMQTNLNGREDRIWTCNPLVPNQVLYQVEPLPDLVVRSKGFEPLTFWFVAKDSIQLSYERKIFFLDTYNISTFFKISQ